MEADTKRDGVMTRVADAAQTVIGWFNPSTGHGDPTKDKAKGVMWGGGVVLNETTLESLYAFNDLAYTIVSARPEWAMRNGWDLLLEAPDDDDGAAAVTTQKIESGVRYEMDRLEAHDAQLEGAKWGELFGGGLVLVGAVDGRPTALPLNEEAIRSIEWLRVTSRVETRIVLFDQDMGSGRLGQPVLYEVRDEFGRFSLWHYTRVIAYPGAHTPKRLKRQNRGWDYSVLDRVLATLSGYDSLWDYTRAMMADGSVGIWKIKGLFQQAMNGNFENLRARLSIADEVKSMFSSLILDADGEDYQYLSRQFAGVADLLGQSAIRTAAAAQMPATVLFGQSPAGMNATGESDIRLWYDRVEAYDESVLRSRRERIITLIFKSKEGPTGGVEPAGWKALARDVRKPTPMEQLERRARQAQIDTANINAKIVDADEVAVSRFTSEGWSAETQIAIEPRRLRLRAKRNAEIARLKAEVAIPAAATPPTSSSPDSAAARARAVQARDLRVRQLMLERNVDRPQAEALLANQDADAAIRADAGDGVMVGVFLDPDIAATIAIAGGETPEDLHITLAYLGKHIDPAAVGFLAAAIARFAASASPLAGSVAGVGRFNASSTSDGRAVLYASVDVPGLSQLRTQLVSVIESIVPVRTEHDFTPHITLGYVDPASPIAPIVVPTLALRVAAIELVIGGARQRFALGELPALELPALPARASDVTDPSEGGAS